MTYTYNFGKLNFESRNQSLYGSGTATAAKGTAEIFKLDLGLNKTLLDASVGASPAKVSAKATLNSSGGVGLEAYYEANLGSVDTNVLYDSASLGVPNRKFRVDESQGFNLSGSAFFNEDKSNSNFETSAFKLEAGLRAFAELDAVLDVESSIYEGSVQVADLDRYEIDIINISPSGFGFLKFGGGSYLVSINGLKGSIAFVGDAITQKLGVSAAVGPFSHTSDTSGGDDDTVVAPVELASLDFDLNPAIDSNGEPKNGNIEGGGVSNKLLDLNIDLDGIVQYAISAITSKSGTPFLFPTVPINLGPVEGDFQFFDIDVGPAIRLAQDFKFEPNLSVNLDFSAPVNIAGNLKTSHEVSIAELPNLNIQVTEGVTEIEPTFLMKNTFGSKTAIRLLGEATVDFLKGSIGVGPVSAGFGPVLSATEDFKIADIPIVDREFEVGGFNEVGTQNKIVLTTSESRVNGGMTGLPNQGPEANADAIVVTEDDDVYDLAWQLLGNDYDINAYDVLSFTEVDTAPTTGVVVWDTANATNPNGSLYYSPQPFQFLDDGESEKDTFEYTIKDEAGLISKAVFTATVQGINDAPVSVDDAIGAKADDVTTFDSQALLSNDTDIDIEPLVVESVDDSDSQGTVSISGGVITYDPNGQFDGLPFGQTATDTFEYTITDGDLTSTSTVTVTVFGTGEVVPASLDPSSGSFAGSPTSAAPTESYLDRVLADIQSGNVSSAVVQSQAPQSQVVSNGSTGLDVSPIESDAEIASESSSDGNGIIAPEYSNRNDTSASTSERFSLDNYDIIIGQAEDNFFDFSLNSNALGVFGLAGNDIILTGSEDDIATGNQGDDMMSLGNGDDIGLGGRGNDTIDGGSGDDVLNGNLGSDAIAGGLGEDIVFGGQGNDELSGGAGDDILSGDLGADIINGNDGNDILFGGQQSDRISGGFGDDLIAGGKDNDITNGDEGNDLVFGNLGDDLVDGGAGDDSLFGGKDNDTVTGGSGDDLVSGDLGDDILTGGEGSDTFRFIVGGGVDIVTDFTVGEDKLAFVEPLTPESLDIEAENGNTTISFSGELLATLQGVTNLSTADFGLA